MSDLRYAPGFEPTPAQKHKQNLVRYIVLAVAFVAVVLLIAIALYYTQGNAIHLQHVSSLALHLSFSAPLLWRDNPARTVPRR